MIKLITNGTYKLIETSSYTKILLFDMNGKPQFYAWINAEDIGEILVTTHKPHRVDHTLAVGKFRLYEVKAEPKLTDLIHLELLVGEGLWQGYLLPVGMPNGVKRRRIIPTKEIITKSTY
jgi:hypothetical protein